MAIASEFIVDRAAPFIDVRVQWAVEHKWSAGQQLAASAPAAHALWLMLDGEVEVVIGQRTWLMRPPMACLHPAGVARDLVAPRGGEWLSIGLHANWLGRVDLLQPLALPAVWTPDGPQRELLLSWMSQLIVERARVDAAGSLMSEGLARALLGLCWRMLGVREVPEMLLGTVPRWFMLTLRHIREAPGTPVQELAQHAGFSAAQFRRRFSELTGLAPRAYLQQHRLQAAQLLLETTELPVGQVAEQLGFESVPHFNHQFKRALGRSPSDFRRESKRARV